MSEKKYYWLKLKADFFDEKYIRALRRLPQGDSLVIVYLKMQLKSLKTEGLLQYEHILPDAISELALLLDEDETIVQLAVNALIKFGVVERWENGDLYFVAMQQLIGSETSVAARVRKHRELKDSKTKALQCNTLVTNCNTDIDIDKELEIELEQDIENREDKKWDNGGTMSRQNENEQKSKIIIEIVDYLNAICGTSYKASTDKTRKLINARLNEGFTVDDFKTVIHKKSREWLNTDYAKYLRPETLFGTKFESYLNALNSHNNLNGNKGKTDTMDMLESLYYKYEEEENETNSDKYKT